MPNGVRSGSYATTDPSEIINFGAGISATQYDTIESPRGTNYQVSAGKTLYITKVYFYQGTSGGSIEIGYGDDAADDAAGSPTNYVALTGRLNAKTAEEVYIVDCCIPIPAEKYPCVHSINETAQIWLEGIEV